jgi:hypothetical protein
LKQKLKEHESKVVKMIERQTEERKQIQSKMVELNQSTNVEPIQTVYKKTIHEIKDRVKKREEYAERFKLSQLKSTLGGEDEGDDDESGGRANKSVDKDAVVDPEAIKRAFREKEQQEFEGFFDLKKDDDWTDFEKRSKHWNEAKKKRFWFLKNKHVQREYCESELAKSKEGIKRVPFKPPAWDSGETIFEKSTLSLPMLPPVKDKNGKYRPVKQPQPAPKKIYRYAEDVKLQKEVRERQEKFNQGKYNDPTRRKAHKKQVITREIMDEMKKK